MWWLDNALRCNLNKILKRQKNFKSQKKGSRGENFGFCVGFGWLVGIKFLDLKTDYQLKIHSESVAYRKAS